MVIYKPHQIIPINYLSKKENRGLIVNHYMGSGKTFIGLGFANKFKHKQIIIIVPNSIKFVWETEIKNNNFEFEDLIILGYDDIFDLLEFKNIGNSVIIIDEAHNLINIIKDSKNSLQSPILVKRLQSSHKIMCLTGTPMYNQEHDLAYLINIVAGKNIMSYSDFRWKRKFYKIKRAKSFFVGWLLVLFYVFKQVDLYTIKQLGPVIELLIKPFDSK